MQEINITRNVSAEALIAREITFRRSTFDALKAFIQRNQRNTGQLLTNAAAVDRLLRRQLGLRADR